MKRTILIFITLMLGMISSYSQKCKYDYDKKDEITGQSVKAIHVRQMTKGCSLIQIEDSFALSIAFVLVGDRKEIVKTGDSLIVKLENEKIIYLFAKGDALPVARTNSISDGKGGVTQSGVMSYYTVTYRLPREKLQELKGSPIRLCRVTFAGLLLNLDFKDKGMLRIQNGAICMDGSK
jgi:hypothetical protein